MRRTGGQKWPISISTTITAIFLFLVPFFPPFLQNVPFQNVFRLQIIDSRLQIAEIVGCRLQIANYRFQIVYIGCKLQIKGCRLQVAGSRLQVVDCML